MEKKCETCYQAFNITVDFNLKIYYSRCLYFNNSNLPEKQRW